MRLAFRNAAELEPRPEFAADLRDRLQAAFAAPPRRFGLGRGWWLLAASLVLGAALAGIFERYGSVTPSRVLARLAAGDHQNCALRFRLTEKPISLEEAAQQYGAVYHVLQQLPPNDLMTAGGLAHVVERHSCVYGGRRFAHVVIKYRDALVSLLVTRDEGRATTAIPDDALAQVKAEGRIEGMSVVSFRAARHTVFLVGDLAQADLLPLATVAASSLRQQLSGI
jgi:hypothetical protein